MIEDTIVHSRQGITPYVSSSSIQANNTPWYGGKRSAGTLAKKQTPERAQTDDIQILVPASPN